MVKAIAWSRTIARLQLGKKICAILIAARWESQTISVTWPNPHRRRLWS